MWTEHSERATLLSWTAAGVSEAIRRELGPPAGFIEGQSGPISWERGS